MPVKQFWFLNVYDAATFAFIYTPNERASLSSFDAKKMKSNPDGGVTLYIGPKAPAEQEANWIPTLGQKAAAGVPALRRDRRLLRQDRQAAGFRTGDGEREVGRSRSLSWPTFAITLRRRSNQLGLPSSALSLQVG